MDKGEKRGAPAPHGALAYQNLTGNLVPRSCYKPTGCKRDQQQRQKERF